MKFTGKIIEIDDLFSLQEVKENITWLNLADCRLNDDQLNYLTELPNLTRLKIQKNPMITDRGIAILTGLKNLSELNLYGTRVSDEAFFYLGQMTGLKKLFLWNTKVTQKGIVTFQAQHPDVEVNAGL